MPSPHPTQMSILHNLPIDVIRFNIFSRLDWSSRVIANTLLHPADRLSFPLKKDAGISLMIRKEHDILKKKLDFVNQSVTPERKYHFIMTLMTSMKDVKYLLEYSSNFRAIFLERCQGFADIESCEYVAANISDDEKQALASLCQGHIKRLETLPFQRDVVSSCKDTWTAVGAGPPHIVKATAYYKKWFTDDDYEEEARWARHEELAY